MKKIIALAFLAAFGVSVMGCSSDTDDDHGHHTTYKKTTVSPNGEHRTETEVRHDSSN